MSVSVQWTGALTGAAFRRNIFSVSTQILSDTKELQKEINNLTGKLDRTFAVTDELVFKVSRGFFYRFCLLSGCERI